MLTSGINLQPSLLYIWQVHTGSWVLHLLTRYVHRFSIVQSHIHHPGVQTPWGGSVQGALGCAPRLEGS